MTGLVLAIWRRAVRQSWPRIVTATAVKADRCGRIVEEKSKQIEIFRLLLLSHFRVVARDLSPLDGESNRQMPDFRERPVSTKCRQ
jgi:hypothetical protein